MSPCSNLLCDAGQNKRSAKRSDVETVHSPEKPFQRLFFREESNNHCQQPVVPAIRERPDWAARIQQSIAAELSCHNRMDQATPEVLHERSLNQFHSASIHYYWERTGARQIARRQISAPCKTPFPFGILASETMRGGNA